MLVRVLAALNNGGLNRPPLVAFEEPIDLPNFIIALR